MAPNKNIAAPQPTPQAQPNSHTVLLPRKSLKRVNSELNDNQYQVRLIALPKFNSALKETGYKIKATSNDVTAIKKKQIIIKRNILDIV